MKWYINIGQRFNWNDIDEKALDEHVEVEYKKFLGKERRHNGSIAKNII